ncbi:ComF family protein [bacterium]|nr:ComF family protein [bacterium]
MIKTAFDSFLNFFFPAECKICRQPLTSFEEKYVCARCFSRIEIVSCCCKKCGLPLAASFEEVKDPLCEQCQRKKRQFHLSRSATPFFGNVRECIHLFKYSKKMGLAKPLGDLMLKALLSFWPDLEIDLILPVPLHSDKEYSRGFNQAYLLAGEISKGINLPVVKGNLQRVVNTASQTSLSPKERLKNVKGAFKIKRPEALAKKKILLIDDVFTTGATVEECSRILKAAGVREVNVFTLARTVG